MKNIKDLLSQLHKESTAEAQCGSASHNADDAEIEELMNQRRAHKARRQEIENQILSLLN